MHSSLGHSSGAWCDVGCCGGGMLHRATRRRLVLLASCYGLASVSGWDCKLAVGSAGWLFRS